MVRALLSPKRVGRQPVRAQIEADRPGSDPVQAAACNALSACCERNDTLDRPRSLPGVPCRGYRRSVELDQRHAADHIGKGQGKGPDPAIDIGQ